MKYVLWVCLVFGGISAIAWALGWDYGAFGILIAMAVSAFPMFHFAMSWPLKNGNGADRESEGEDGCG